MKNLRKAQRPMRPYDKIESPIDDILAMSQLRPATENIKFPTKEELDAFNSMVKFESPTVLKRLNISKLRTFASNSANVQETMKQAREELDLESLESSRQMFKFKQVQSPLKQQITKPLMITEALNQSSLLQQSSQLRDLS